MSDHTSQHDQDRSPIDPDQPSNLLAFVQRFPTEEACEEYLFDLRWPEGFVCPKCSDTQGHKLPRHKAVWVCRHGHQTSLTANTVMHRTRQPLTVWFYGAYLVSTLTPGISALQFQKQLGLSRYETAFQLLHKLRSAMVAPDREPLHDEVQVDEALIGGTEHTGRRGRGTGNKALVVVGVEVIRWVAPDPHDPENPHVGIERMRAGRIRASVVPNAKAETLLPWVKRNVVEGSMILTDGHESYKGLSELGYSHAVVLATRHGRKTGEHLELVDLIISNLKRWLLGTHKGAVSHQHLQAYLNEFVFRFNRRFWRGPAFVRALGLSISADERPEYKTLYGSAEEKPRWVHPNPRPPLGAAETGNLVDVVWKGLVEKADPSIRAWMRGHEATLRGHIRAEVEGAAEGEDG